MPVIVVVACVAVVALVITRARQPRRRSARSIAEPIAEGALSGRDSAEYRFARLQNSLDAIAVEVERISEHQRFLTKLLATESLNAAVTTSRDT